MTGFRSTLFLIFIFSAKLTVAQMTVSGRVFDSSKLNYVENVRVISTGGLFAITDSLGQYSIMANESDSLYFFYDNRPTQKFPVANISAPHQFDISLRVRVKSKYRVLKEVIVYSKTYKQDSLENRQTYADVFDYEKPGIKSTISPSGVAGADINELINIFRFKRNKRLEAFRSRLEEQEREKYVNVRFNKILVRRITGLKSPALDTFLVRFRPSYEFTRNSDDLRFYQYILNSSYQFARFYPMPGKIEK